MTDRKGKVNSRYGHLERKAEKGTPGQPLDLGKDHPDGINHGIGRGALAFPWSLSRTAVAVGIRRRYSLGGRERYDIPRHDGMVRC